MTVNSQNQLVEFTQAIAMMRHEKDQIRKGFNPNDEPIHVLKVIQQKEMKTLRPWIGAMQIDKKRTDEYGSPQHERVPPTPRKHTLSEKDKHKSGPHDTINCIDPDMIDSETELPVWRTFRKGEIFLAVDTSASNMLHHGFAIAVPKFKNEIIEETGKVRFDWAEEDEVISDDNAILIPKYHEKYSRNAGTILTIANELISMRNEVAELKAQMEGVKNGK